MPVGDLVEWLDEYGGQGFVWYVKRLSGNEFTDMRIVVVVDDDQVVRRATLGRHRFQRLG